MLVCHDGVIMMLSHLIVLYMYVWRFFLCDKSHGLDCSLGVIFLYYISFNFVSFCY